MWDPYSETSGLRDVAKLKDQEIQELRRDLDRIRAFLLDARRTSFAFKDTLIDQALDVLARHRGGK